MSSLISTYPAKLSEEFYNIATLTGLLRWRALRQPDKVAYTYLTDGESAEVSLTYAELDRRARAVAARLQQTGRRGDRVLLLYPPGLGYVAAFFGCLYAEMIAVPAYPPDPSKFSRSLPRLQTMLTDSGANVALTTEPILSRARLLFDESPMLESLDWMSFDETPTGAEDDWRENSGVSTDLAFLQYTSGSTGAPKGVMLTHENLLHNASLVYHGVEHSDGDKYVSWLPVFHDMGFMAGILQPLYAGIDVVSMSPVAFLQRPLLWLQAISRYRATTSGGPNFAYDLCARKITPEQRAELDLSNWSVAFNGAEPIRAETLDRFVEAFGPCGFKREAFYPCYGLAEATLIVTGSGKTRQPVSKALHARALENNLAVEAADVAAGAEARTLVGCGRTLLDQKVLVVNPETRIRCESGEVGEVWVNGASVAQGYWGKPDETELTFRASLRHTGEGPFLRTGDLGFMSGGELYITGRLKDLIIVRGLNHYPQDVELTVERSNPSLRPGCGAAFSVEVEGEEKLAVVQEIDVRRQPDVDAVLDGIREAVAREHELQVYAVALIKPGRIPKTTSGKIQRRATRAAFLAGKLDIIAEWSADKAVADAPEEQPAADGPQQEISEVAAWMCAQIAARLGVAPASIDVHQPIARYGLDSLAAIELVHGIETQHGVVLPMTSFLQSFSVAELSAQITERLASPADGARGRLTRPEQDAAEYPLSPGQQALWFLHQLAPESPAYNISAAVRVEAELDVPALRRAFEKIVERHPSLRATFSASQDGPAQAISAGTPFHFGEEDAEGWDEARLDERLLGEANRPFDLEHGPLLRVWLFRRSAGEHVLLLAVHHIVADFWSLALLMHELGELYAAERAGSQAVLPAPSLRYTDYARWQAETMAGPEGERLWAYWQKQLGGSLPVLNLPTDRPRPPVQTYRGRSFSFRLSAELTAGLKELSRRHEATLYMTLLASFQVLLHRYTGQEQFLVGSPTAGRRSAELADIVGYFVNPIVLRADLSQDPSFEQYLGRVRQTVLGAFEHQEYPFPLLVERLQPERDASRSPIFQVMFALQKTHLPTGESLSLFALGEAGTRHTLGELPLESVALEERVAQFDLTLMMAQAEDGLAGSLQYNTDLFDDQTVERMATHFQTLVEGIVADARNRLSGLPLVPAPESHKLLVEWNETRREYDSEACVQRLFEAQAEQTPDAPAVVCGPESLTYGELNARANQLARRLRAAGVGAEDTVGILTERSASMVVGLLGVLKAGGAYLPLDTAYPRERLSFMLRDARARVLLTQDSLAAEVEIEGLHVIRLDADWPEIAREDESNFDGGAASDNLAYVIYTSGSTGRPKGVEIAHGGLVNLVNWHQRAYGVTAGDRATQLAGTAFDASVWELWPYLTAGACIYMPDDETRASSWKLLRWLADNAVTICFLPTPLAEAVVEEALPPGLALRAVLTGGDVLHRAPRKALPFMLVNHYGPTENTVVTTRAAVAQGVEESLTPPPIGQPIDNTRVYLLDKHLRPVPVGVPGEMYVGGDGLARGYRHRPGLTAERFIPDPFSTEQGARLYRTGDLARYAPDGNIEFLGRLDHQVKVRGYRIELGEIEALLARHADVREAIVVAWEDVTGHTRLAAYITPATEHATAAPLQSFLREKLPEYMVPSSFIFVEEMPLTANGKIDRAALPAPAAQGAEASEDAALPRTPVEELLAGIWGQVLGRKRVGVNDNFFELGGHSLLATQAISRIRETLKVEIPLHRLFSAPTVAGLAAHVEDALRADQPLDAPPLVPVLRDGDLPLSFAQQRLWFLDQLEPGSSFYNIPAAVRLRGNLDQGVLEQSLNEIVRRHESLRTTFLEVNGQPVQLITAPQPLPLTALDLRDLPADEKLERVNAAAVEEARSPFDLSTGPLTRVTLLRLDEDEYVLLLTLHHIIADGWSMGVLMRELTALYNAYSRGEASPLPELPIQYADFARWQREWLSGSALDTQLAYWRQQLSGAPALLELPSDRPRPAVQSHRGAQRSVTLGRELSAELAAMSRGEGVTLFMLLLSGFQALLSRVTGQEDVSVGTPVAGRGRAEAEGLVGLFVNTLVLRADLSGDPSFSELLGRVRETCVGAYAHQDVPFEKLVEELAPERNLSHSPLFQVMFAWQDSALHTLGLTDVELCEIDGDTCTSKFDLTLYMSEGKEGLIARAEYNTDLFDAETIGRLLTHFASLLAAATADPSRKVTDLPLLGAEERELILEGWNQTQQPYDRGACLHQLFEQQAALTPDATALVGGPHRLSYDELNRQANRLAHRLRALGVGAESRVGVMLSRSPSVLVSLLAVLKSGGAYVPLDPAYPRERLSFMLGDARVKVLLTETAFLTLVPEGEAQLICLDADADVDAFASESDENLPAAAMPENLAYVIYTSGSTGVPKGVAIAHRSAIAFLDWARGFFTEDELSSVLAATSINFDLSVFELFAPLAVGGTVLLADNALALPALDYAGEVKLINTVPSAMAELVRQGAVPSSVTTVNLAGEALPRRLVQTIYESSEVAKVVNLYGPSEDTTYTTWEVVADSPGAPVLIGRPVANTRIYILDGRMEPAPVGVAGELYTSGEGLARGYLNRPSLTAEKFVPDPFASEPGGRMYRTGDVARFLADGRIEYLGRADHQVKVRGFRIELGEIEAALERHEGVERGVVMVKEAEGGDKRLVAYVVAKGGREVTASELRGFLKGGLPEYMVPSSFVMLDELPLTPNGKVDRKRLPEPEAAGVGGGGEYAAPRTQVEEVLANVWAEVLGAVRVGINDNFFELGGHSLLATQVMSRIRAAFGVELPLRSLFEEPTVAGLSARVGDAMSVGGARARRMPPLERAPVGGEQPLSFTQQRLWFLDQLEPGSAFYNIAAAARLVGELDDAALAESLREVARRHEALRTRFVSSDGSPTQIIDSHLPLDVQIVDLSHLPEAERDAEARRLAQEEARRPFDLAHGPLLRAELLKLCEREHVLLVTMHHIVSDGWSVGVLMREVAALYDAYSRGEASPLQELPIQYTDFARWQREWLSGPVLDEQLSYWRRQLEGAPPTLELPADRPRPAVQSFNGATQKLVLPEALSESLRALSRAEGVTLYTTLLAALQTLFSRYSGQKDFTVGSPIANRNHLETEGLIGCFTNTMVMRADLSGDPTFRELLRRVWETTLGAHAHQDVPFEKLVEELAPERDLSRSPLFQVMFVLQNASAEGRVSLPGLDLALLDTDGGTARFDLTLSMTDTAGGLTGTLEYNTDLFDGETIGRLLTHFASLLSAAVADPARKVTDLPLLAPEERELILEGWNQTRADYPSDLLIHQLFERQAALTPDATALVGGPHRLSYYDLNRQANRLAHRLHSLGVGAESRVGVMLSRSPSMLVSLLAVLKAGGAYVPLDPAYPRDRLAFMLADADVRVLLTETSFLDILPEHEAQVVCLDSDAGLDAFASESEANLASVTLPENLAYVIYTSGSTGVPKGVAIAHRSAVAFLDWARGFFTEEELSSVLAATSINFDLSVFELFAPLAVGGTVLLAENALALPALDYAGEVKLINTVPSAMAELVRQGAVPSSVTTVNLAGEALPRRLVQAIYESSEVAKVVNLYGPSEDTTYTTWEVVADSPGAPVLIGRPVANTRIYILDGRMEPAPVGVAGELYTSGEGLARGYLNRPSLTAEKFVPDPFASEPGGRMYRTGDVARFLADGRIEYLGRADHQVKVRGFRIELGEIEAALHARAGVRDAVVTAREEVGGGGKRLVAYVVSKDGAALTPAELRQSLKGRLPEYMVPSQFVVLDEMPLTPNGKVDRKRLPEPEPVGAGLAGTYVIPRGAVEEAVAGVWAEVLGTERVGAEDNFFELGGHSLLATQVISRVRAAFGVELPLRSLFEAPTVRGLAARVEAGAGRRLSSLPPLVAGERGGEQPLSFTQQRLWFLDQLEPGSAFYNIAAAARLVGELDDAALAESLREVARRHEALRTRFVTSSGSPVQVIDPSPNLPLPVLDLSGLPEGQREAEFEGLAREEARRPFDLAHGPLLRTSLVRLGEREHVLLVTMHHIVSDGWSVGVLMREVAALYDAYSRGEASPLQELPIQYTDFARWQRECVQGELLETQLSYWKRQLDGAPAALELPLDHPRPAVQTYEGARQSLLLPEALSFAIKKLGRKEGHTLFVTLLTSFVALLHRYTGQQDIVVGSPVSGRNRLETEDLVGFFVNTLALRANLDGGPTFAELAGRVRDAVLEAHAHQDVPFEKIVEALQVERDLSRSPLFQVMFVLKNASADEQKVSGLALAPMEIDNGTAKFDLTLYVEETARGLLGTFEYNTSLFEAPTIARMLAHFHTLLEGVVADEHNRVSDLPLLDGAERRQILNDWNQTEQPYDRAACLHQLFERQAALTPDATALVGGPQQLTYGELNGQANSLARRLRALGVGSESRVGVMLPRTPRMLVSLLAVLKSGGAYVPLDPAYPQERLAFMLADADVRVLLTESSFLATVPEGTAQVVCLDSHVDVDDIPSANEENLVSVLLPENLAYVIYTSGSTGVPKGVAIAHRSAVAFLDWARGFFSEDELSSVLAATSINFDLSVFELFAPLAVGGTVLLAENALALPALDYAGEVKLINTVPSAMAELVRQGAVPASVMTVNLAGEALPRRLVQAIYETSGVGRVVNLYGPSEDTTYTTWEVVEDAPGAPVLIGRPVANTRIYILDGKMEPAPVGVAGELYTAGDGLARGYLNRPSLTAEKFIPNPFASESGGRMYRTGDVARFLADGRIEYLGRADHQVKVRGFRIELGEIEAALERHEGVERGVVMVREGEGGDKRLVAYVAVKGGQAAPTVSELRGFLKGGLPEYMVPSSFVMLDELPLTPNGKVDRKRLPEPEAARPELGASYAPPETETEEAVARVWAEVLGLEAVGRNDNFFELGGHSLMATQVMFALREALDVELPLRSIFEAPTVSELSQAIDTARGNGQGERLGAITRRSRERHRAKASAPQLATVPEVLREITDV